MNMNPMADMSNINNNNMRDNQLLPWPINALKEKGKHSDNTFTLRPYTGYPGHDRALLPRWRILAEKLRRRQNDRLVAMCFRDVHLVPDILDALTPAMATQHLKTLTLHTNRLDNAGYVFLAQFLEGNSTLTTFSLRKNDINCRVDTAKRLGAAIRNHAALGMVDISDCNLGSADIGVFSAMIDGIKDIQNVTLASNSIGSHGSTRTDVIAKALAANPALKKLTLSKNGFGDRDLVLFAQALGTNSNLELLDVFQNGKLHSLGSEALDNAICNSSSLNAVVDGNHTCAVHANHSQPSCSKLSRLYNCPFHFPCSKEDAIRKHIQRKLLDVLGGLTLRRSHAPIHMLHLIDLPVELLPNVLVMIQGESRLTKEGKLTKRELSVALNNVSEVMWRWHFPTLYQFRGSSTPQGKRKRASV